MAGCIRMRLGGGGAEARVCMGACGLRPLISCASSASCARTAMVIAAVGKGSLHSAGAKNGI